MTVAATGGPIVSRPALRVRSCSAVSVKRADGNRLIWCPDCGCRLEIESAISQVTGQRPPICTTDPNHRALDGSLIPIWAAPPVDLIGPGVEEPEDPGCRERFP